MKITKSLLTIIVFTVLTIQSYANNIEDLQVEANNGNVEAMYNLGVIYMNGSNNIPRDYKKAATHLEKAANSGHARAKLLLGVLHIEGKGVKYNYEKGMTLVTEAAKTGDAHAEYVLGFIYNSRGIYKDAITWLSKASNQGYSDAMVELSNIYYDILTYQDYTKGYNLLLQAANLGNSDAQYKLGALFMTGQYVKAQPDKGYEWLNKAANKGSADAHFLLGTMYLKQENMLSAYKHFLVAEKLNNHKFTSSDDKLTISIMLPSMPQYLTHEENEIAKKSATKLYNEIMNNKK